MFLSKYQDDVSIDIIIKYCQKLQTKEKEIEYKSNIENNENVSIKMITQKKLNKPKQMLK